MTQTKQNIRAKYNTPIYMFHIAGNFFLELKDGHVPHGLANHLGNWKAEEYQKILILFPGIRGNPLKFSAT